MKRTKPVSVLSGLLLASGGFLLMFALSEYGVASFRQAELKATWEESPVLPAPSTTAPVRPGAPRAAVPVEEGESVGRLRIPRIGVDAVVLEGISQETLAVAPGHYPGMAFPGDGGHAVISAHRDSFFKDLGELEAEDRISVTRPDGHKVFYGVTKSYVVHRSNRTVIVPRDEEVLTLITCYPFNYVGPAPYRYIVEAFPASP
jgi:sortase A